uniref:KH RNA binding domain containing, signal transduction associated 3 n=1 Tax=Astyanax mexicanus TaxID=7994 RepID=A0A8B9H9P1_ASTMX
SRKIEKVQKDEEKEDEKFIDVVINKNMKLGQKVLIPVKQFPKFNFVGKLLGPRGNSLKRLQEDTLTKMSILGKGSMRDKEKEEELRKSGEAKYNHLNEDLHVLIEVFAPPAEAYARMGHALEEIKKFLIPDYNDEIRQAQLQELTFLNGGSEDAKVPAVRGKSSTRARGTPHTSSGLTHTQHTGATHLHLPTTLMRLEHTDATHLIWAENRCSIVPDLGPHRCNIPDPDLNRCKTPDLDSHRCSTPDLGSNRCNTPDPDLNRCNTPDPDLNRYNIPDLGSNRCNKPAHLNYTGATHLRLEHTGATHLIRT